MSELRKGLMIAIGKAALAKHQETCDRCSDEYSCAVANAHLRTLVGLRNQPTEEQR